MAVFRIERTRDYTVMSNHHLRNANLSLKAKGLLSMMLSLPEDWNYTTRGLAKICKRLWQYIVTRTVKERSYYRYEDGKRVKHTVTPVLGEKAAHNGKVVYSLDFEVTPHQLRHTYITNLIHASVDPKTVQYLAGHESSKITMDIYAKVKYNRPDELVRSMNCAFASWDAAQ